MAKTTKEKLTLDWRTAPAFTEADLLSTGCLTLDLALTGKTVGGFCKGKYYHLVGDSQSGKTFLTLTCFAEAIRNKHFKDYRLIFDDVENGALMDFKKFFGASVAAKVEPPFIDKDGAPYPSYYIEDLYDNLRDALDRKEPFIYVCDSMDALRTLYAERKAVENMGLRRKGKKEKGDYGDGKAGYNSEHLRGVVSRMAEHGSILIIISQTRDNLAPVGNPAYQSFTDQKHAGGRALKFYAAAQIWTAVGQQYKKTIMGKPRKYGMTTRIKVIKNRTEGQEVEVSIPIYYSYGMDNVGSMVEFLVNEGYWKKNDAGIINATDYDWKEKRDAIIKNIETEGLQSDLAELVKEVWDSIQSKMKVDREPRYG